MNNDVFILDAVRSPRGIGKAGKGALSAIHPQELLAQVLNALVARTGVSGADVDDVIVGCVSQVNEQGANIARNAVLSSTLPETVSAVSINRFCGSGLQAVNFAAMGVLSGFQQLAIGGGVESMSKVGLGADGGGQDGGNPVLRNKYFQVPQGISADLIATLEGFSRQELDQFALKSQQNAANAQRDGYFKSLIPIIDPVSGGVVLAADEYLRPNTTLEALASLKPAFLSMGAMQVGPDGETLDELALLKYPQASTIYHLHTAGNSSGIVDGAAAVMLASRAYIHAHALKPRARIKALASIGSEPVIMLTAPASVSRKALALAKMTVEDIDLWEINEAFAAVPLQVIRHLNLDPEKVNVNGGSIALGHPLGATGAILLGTALDELERRDLNTALITLCIGGGQGVATIIERV